MVNHVLKFGDELLKTPKSVLGRFVFVQNACSRTTFCSVVVRQNCSFGEIFGAFSQFLGSFGEQYFQFWGDLGRFFTQKWTNNSKSISDKKETVRSVWDASGTVQNEFNKSCSLIVPDFRKYDKYRTYIELLLEGVHYGCW